MWKCKECGGTIKASISITIIQETSLIPKDKIIIEDAYDFKYCSDDWNIEECYCNKCGKRSEKLEAIAKWED